MIVECRRLSSCEGWYEGGNEGGREGGRVEGRDRGSETHLKMCFLFQTEGSSYHSLEDLVQYPH